MKYVSQNHRAAAATVVCNAQPFTARSGKSLLNDLTCLFWQFLYRNDAVNHAVSILFAHLFFDGNCFRAV